ncbi:hypothetical protein SH661x_003645 [Planctomicrobium sp. SH661]|uniref:hypothetical protein n=1 Tax=Planctomicrobium sp. SH661 TaxID=3448124 RepID=UPI003F5ADFF9
MLTSSLLAADPVPAKTSPLDRLRERSATQRFQESREQYLSESPREMPSRIAEAEAAKEETTSTTSTTPSPAPLDLPLSEFGRGKISLPETRPARPSIVKSVPTPYFETAADSQPEGQSPPISLPDFLDSGSQAIAQVEPTRPSSLMPPEPIAETGQVPGSGLSNFTIPGMEDTVFRPISQIEPYYDYSPTGKRPYEYVCPQPSNIPDEDRTRCPEFLPLPKGGSTDRQFAMIDYQWVPTDLQHKPLYFEDVALERYGQQYPCGIQPFVSVGKFAVQGIGLPYQIAIDPVWRDIYTLGYYRPGDPAPELIYQVPINLKAAAAAGGVYTGLIFLFP